MMAISLYRSRLEIFLEVEDALVNVDARKVGSPSTQARILVPTPIPRLLIPEICQKPLAAMVVVAKSPVIVVPIASRKVLPAVVMFVVPSSVKIRPEKRRSWMVENAQHELPVESILLSAVIELPLQALESRVST